MRALLTPALAASNPKAYMAHFQRLDADARRTYLAALSTEELKAHFLAMGEAATVGLMLMLHGAECQLQAVVGGAPLGVATGADCGALQARALAIAKELGAKVVSGLVSGGSLSRLAALEAALGALDWRPKSIVLAGDSGGSDCNPVLGWSLRGTIGDAGTFYMPSEALIWGERAQVEALLREFASRHGAVLDVRT